jgi:hypothetical protein
MKGLLIRNQGFALHKCFSGHLRRPQLRTFWMQRGQKTWFLTALCYVWLTILFAFVLLPTLAMAAPALAPLTPQPFGFAQGRPWGERGAATRQGPTVRIDPTQSVVGAGRTFDISVMIEDANDLGGFEFTMLCITTTVTIDSVTVGDFPGSTGRSVIPIVLIIDNQTGLASFAVVTVGSDPGPSGTGVLATVALTAQGSGESPLALKDVTVVNTDGRPQTLTVEDGVVRVGFAVYLPLMLRDW